MVESSVDVRTIEGFARIADLTVFARTVVGGVEISRQPSTAVPVIRSSASHAAFAGRVLRHIISMRRAYDVVVVQNYGLAALAANVAGRIGRVPTVMQVGSPLEEYYKCREADQTGPKPFRRWELRVLEVVARLNALVGQRYVVVSEHLADVVRSHGGRHPVDLCPIYGVDTKEFAPTPKSKSEIRRSLGLPETGHIVFFSSRIAPEKDVDTLLRAVRALADQSRDVTLLNASGGYRELQARATVYGIEKNLVALPAVDPRTELAQLYQAADLCVQASRAEGLGFSPLEAMACGVPVVSAQVGGLRENVVNGVTGWTYAPGDAEGLARAIASVLDDPTGGRDRLRAARALVEERFKQSIVFARFGELLEAVAEQSRSASRSSTSGAMTRYAP